MDDTDWRIIDFLLRDARTSFSEIGKVLGLGKDAIQKRVKKLRSDGILGIPITIFDAKKCGFEGIVDFFVKISNEGPGILDIQKELAEYPYTLQVTASLGDYNLYFSSFFRNFEDIRRLVEKVKKNASVSSFEMAIYSQDISNPMILPFLNDQPENSIIYKIQNARK
jgi:DNA-binding Lrp family transcriptional regulator